MSFIREGFDEFIIYLYHLPVMLSRLPRTIDALELADRNATIQGELEISCFDRLAELLSDNVGKVTVELAFRKQGRLAIIEGHISAVLAVQCQRCLEAIAWRIDNNIRLGVASSAEQAKKLPVGFEPLILADDDKISLKSLVEDEILLLLPDIPKHQTGCATPLVMNGQTNLLPNQNKKASPFSVLADLKNLETKNGSTKK